MRRWTVNEVMTRAVVSAYRGASVTDIARVMLESGVSAMPVIDDGHRVAGVVSESDLFVTKGYKDDRRRRRFGGRRERSSPAKAGALTAQDVMTTPAIVVHPEAAIAEAARLLDRHRIKCLPVTGDQNRLIGVVSRHDLLRVFTRPDDEIREEILDEVFAHLPPTRPEDVSVLVSHGVVTLSGTLPQKSMIPIAVRLTAATHGVVRVIDELSCATRTPARHLIPRLKTGSPGRHDAHAVSKGYGR